jgi:integrase
MRLTKRGRVWYGYVYVDGRRVQRTTKRHDRKAAERVVQQWERTAADPDHQAAEDRTMSDALRLLLDRRAEEAAAGRKAADTVAFYRKKAGHLVRIFETAECGTRVPFPLARLRPHHVDDYISRRRSEGVKDSTIHKELVTLRGALKLARRRGWWTGALEEVLPVAFSPRYEPRERFLTPAELQALLAQLAPHRAAQVAFIVATSANWGESTRARPEHVSADRRFVHLVGTKTDYRERDVPIVTPEQRSLLDVALEQADPAAAPLLFHPWANVRRDMLQACERAGIERCSPNDLRRTCATWLRAGGATIDALAPLMGHADGRMVERVYGRLTPEQLRSRLAREVSASTNSTTEDAHERDGRDGSGVDAGRGADAGGRCDQAEDFRSGRGREERRSLAGVGGRVGAHRGGLLGRPDGDEAIASADRHDAALTPTGDCINSASDPADAAGLPGPIGQAPSEKSLKSEELQCPGAESNHRHGDFQSPSQAWVTRRNSSRPYRSRKPTASTLHQSSPPRAAKVIPQGEEARRQGAAGIGSTHNRGRRRASAALSPSTRSEVPGRIGEQAGWPAFEGGGPVDVAGSPQYGAAAMPISGPRTAGVMPGGSRPTVERSRSRDGGRDRVLQFVRGEAGSELGRCWGGLTYRPEWRPLLLSIRRAA